MTGPGVDRLAEKFRTARRLDVISIFSASFVSESAKLLKMVGEFLQRRQQIDLPRQRSLHPSVRGAGRLLRLAHAVEEILRFVAEIGHQLLPVQHPMMDEQPFLRCGRCTAC